jgi:hypothetical protein
MAELQLTQADYRGHRGSWNRGRVTIKDLENFLGTIEGQTAEKPSAIRTGVADAMRRSWTRPLATVGPVGLASTCAAGPQRRDPKPVPHCMLCAPSRSPWQKRRGSCAVDRRTRDSVAGRSTSASPSKRRRDHGPDHSRRGQNDARRPTTLYTPSLWNSREAPRYGDMTAGGIASVIEIFGTFGPRLGNATFPLPDQTLLLGLGAGKKMPTWTTKSNQFVPNAGPNSRSGLRTFAASMVWPRVDCSNAFQSCFADPTKLAIEAAQVAFLAV